MARNKTSNIKKEDVLQIYCRRCQTLKTSDKFYEAMNPSLDTNGYMSVCRDCCNEIYDEYFNEIHDIEKSIFLTCEDLDIRFSKEAIISTKSHVDSFKSKGRNIGKIFGIYKSKLSSTGKSNGMTNFRFKDSNESLEDVQDDKVKNKLTIRNLDTDYENESIEIIYLKDKWGNEIPIESLIWLEQKYNEWYDNYDIQGKAMELLIEQLCFEEFFMYQERQKGQDVSKRLKNVQDMMKSSKLSPRQETASEQAEFQTISEFIKKVEQTKPFVKKNSEFEDVDSFNKMWKSVAGAISRTNGKPDENTEVFNEFFKDSTMDLSGLSEDGEK